VNVCDDSVAAAHPAHASQGVGGCQRHLFSGVANSVKRIMDPFIADGSAIGVNCPKVTKPGSNNLPTFVTCNVIACVKTALFGVIRKSARSVDGTIVYGDAGDLVVTGQRDESRYRKTKQAHLDYYL
jgi:hypothetical protein